MAEALHGSGSALQSMYIYLGTWLVGYYVSAMHNSAQTALTFSPTTGYALTRQWKRGLWSIQAGFVG